MGSLTGGVALSGSTQVLPTLTGYLVFEAGTLVVHGPSLVAYPVVAAACNPEPCAALCSLHGRKEQIRLQCVTATSLPVTPECDTAICTVLPSAQAAFAACDPLVHKHCP